MKKRISIIALHGFTGAGSDFDPIVDDLSGPIDWLAPDLPGHGENKLKCSNVHHYFAFLQTLDEKRDKMLKNVPPIIMGYSMGARLALSYALECNPSIEALILIGGSPGIEDCKEREERWQADEGLATRLESIGVEQFLVEWQNQDIVRSQKNLPEAMRESMAAARKQHTAEGLAGALRAVGSGVLPNYWDALHCIDYPVWHFVGEHDKKYCDIADKMGELIPNYNKIVVPNAGHAAHLENPPFFKEQLQLIIDQLGIVSRV